MPNQEDITNLTTSAEIVFQKLGITDEMYDAIIDYLLKGGALTSCGTRTGCDGGCPQGQSCGRFYRANCICKKDD